MKAVARALGARLFSGEGARAWCVVPEQQQLLCGGGGTWWGPAMLHGGRSFAAPAARAGSFDGEGERAQHAPGHDGASDLDAAAMRAWGALHPLLKRSVVQLGLREPTEIQRMSLSKNVAPQWRDSLLLAETGSGKTLAYLLPTLHRLKQIEEETAARARPRRPRALVVVPTRELGEQVSVNCVVYY